MKTRHTHFLLRTVFTLSFCLTMLAGPLLSIGQTVVISQSGYSTSGALTNVLGSSSDYNTFLQMAWTNNQGGACRDLAPAATAQEPTSFYTIFGADGTLRLNYSFNQNMQAATSGGSFRPLTPAADPRCILQGADSTSWMLTFNSIVDASTQSAFDPALGIGSVGFTILPRNHSTYPLDVRVTVTLSDSSTMTSTIAVGGSGSIVADIADRIGYFLTYRAPSGKTIASLTFETFQTNTTTPVSTRLAIDQLGFALPLPPKGTVMYIK